MSAHEIVQVRGVISETKYLFGENNDQFVDVKDRLEATAQNGITLRITARNYKKY